ncbi:MAG TPA: hypothetical protein PKY50_12245 [Candidatus Competibacter sp.]|nr:hypothetical protein [Candidatus Competibacter sp.]
MEPISKLNRADCWHRILRPVPFFALCIALSVGLLQRQLALIYARPKAVVAAPVSPAGPPARREDAGLFDRAWAVGLLRPAESGRIAVAPADLPLRQAYARAYPELLVPRAGEPDWLGGVWNDEVRRIHRALHFGAAGRYVRQQVEAFNARRSTRVRRTGEKFSWWDGSPAIGAGASRSPNAAGTLRGSPGGTALEPAQPATQSDAVSEMDTEADGEPPDQR